jgi:hypothetical protein
MALFQTYETVGIKEDISDIISNITPTKVPFQTAIGNEKVTQTVFQWQEDSLRSVNSGGTLEGADGTDVTVTPTVMRSNTTQIFAETVKVSGTLDAVSTYGRARESAYQLAKSAAQLKRDLENAYVGTAAAKVVGADATARVMASAQVQIAAANNVYTGGVSTAMSEANLLLALQNVYNAGADPSLIQVTPANSLIVAAFAAAAGRYRTLNTGDSNSQSTLINVVNLYVSPFGEQKIQLNRFLKASEAALIIDPSMWSKVTLRPWFRETLAKTGDSLKQMIIGEFSLKHKNQAAAAMVIEQISTGF